MIRRPASLRSCSFIQASRSGLRGRSHEDSDQRPGARRLLVVLVDEHIDLGGAAVLGKQGKRSDQFGCLEDYRALTAGGGDEFPGSRLSATGVMGPSCL